ncbi:MAG: branched-chain amino acid ABC transporter permease [Solirubrobacteraceae bacterium]|jgi:branched-chain amino acid transport system permease protein
MQILLQTIVNGLTAGSVYALIALGYTMVYGVLKLLNFAHGDLFMVGAFIGYFAIGWFGGPTALSIPVWVLIVFMFAVASFGVGALGVAIERFAYRPLRNAPRIAPLITALGVSFVLENSVLLLFGGLPRSYDSTAFIPFSLSIHIDSVSIGIIQILTLVLSVLLMVGLLFLVNHTILGKSMRAVASDREAAEMLGIDVNRTISMTFLIGSALAGSAGVMYGLGYANQVSNVIGFLAGLKAFTAAVVGGIGSIPGAMIGGLFIGLCESFSLSYVSSEYGDLMVFGILIAVMLIRPTGLFGQAPLQKV